MKRECYRCPTWLVVDPDAVGHDVVHYVDAYAYKVASRSARSADLSTVPPVDRPPQVPQTGGGQEGARPLPFVVDVQTELL